MSPDSNSILHDEVGDFSYLWNNGGKGIHDRLDSSKLNLIAFQAKINCTGGKSANLYFYDLLTQVGKI